MGRVHDASRGVWPTTPGAGCGASGSWETAGQSSADSRARSIRKPWIARRWKPARGWRLGGVLPHLEKFIEAGNLPVVIAAMAADKPVAVQFNPLKK